MLTRNTHPCCYLLNTKLSIYLSKLGTFSYGESPSFEFVGNGILKLINKASLRSTLSQISLFSAYPLRTPAQVLRQVFIPSNKITDTRV